MIFQSVNTSDPSTNLVITYFWCSLRDLKPSNWSADWMAASIFSIEYAKRTLNTTTRRLRSLVYLCSNNLAAWNQLIRARAIQNWSCDIYNFIGSAYIPAEVSKRFPESPDPFLLARAARKLKRGWACETIRAHACVCSKWLTCLLFCAHACS